MDQVIDSKEQDTTAADAQAQIVELSIDDLANVGGGVLGTSTLF